MSKSEIQRFAASTKKNFDAVALTASAGGLACLTTVLSELPSNFPCPILIVQHLLPTRKSLMAGILSKKTSLIVKEAKHDELIEESTVYIAPPDHHMLVTETKCIQLTQSKLVNFVRPSADVLFESLPAVYGKRSICVVLSGTGRDGAAGVKAVKRAGGVVIALDESAEYFDMPGSAIDTGTVDYVLPLDKVAMTLIRLVMTDPKVKTP